LGDPSNRLIRCPRISLGTDDRPAAAAYDRGVKVCRTGRIVEISIAAGLFVLVGTLVVVTPGGPQTAAGLTAGLLLALVQADSARSPPSSPATPGSARPADPSGCSAC